MDLVNEILRGIRDELDDTPEYYEFRVKKSEEIGSLWSVQVDLTDNFSSGLDESLEEAIAWWFGPPSGSADVLSVIPEEETINLRFATKPPPSKGESIRIYPPRYLDALLQTWKESEWAFECLARYNGIQSLNALDETQIPTSNLFSELRQRQSDAHNLLGWNYSFLHGPPGTGKTYSLGRMLASYLIKFPKNKILLLSTTNIAVDQAIVSVDKALEALKSTPLAKSIRNKCSRVGNHFIASNYSDRKHLLPIKDFNLISRLILLEEKKPDANNIEAYSHWKDEIEHVRAKMREQAASQLSESNLVAMTTTLAVFMLEKLKILKPFDLIVFDEASQVGLAHSLALLPLAKRCLFTGDPEQLAPIVKSESRRAKEWLGKSIFAKMDRNHSSMCFLNEQSRMAKPICNVISNVFYNGELIVAKECESDINWIKERTLRPINKIPNNNIYVKNIDASGKWSNKYHGPIRFESAEFIKDLVKQIKDVTPEIPILVLTPFRAQRTLLKILIRNAGIRKVRVSTVHRAQGSECHTVIFDPVQGNSKFLQTADASHLINVALSRAKARLIITLSNEDIVNPRFRQIYDIVIFSDKPRQAKQISYFASQSNFPKCAIGEVVKIKDVVGCISRVINNGEKFVLVNIDSGKEKTYKTEFVIKNFS